MFQTNFNLESLSSKRIKVFDKVRSKMCYDAPGVWSHTNVNYAKNDVVSQEGLIEMMLGL